MGNSLMTQLDLFNRSESEPLAEPTGALPGPPAESQRDGDCRKILAELRRGPTTNVALQDLVMGYRQRISDLRKQGFTITNRRLSGRTSLYELKESTHERTHNSPASRTGDARATD